MNSYLLDYLINSTKDPLVKKYIDYLKIELDWHLYAYGDNLSSQYHRNHAKTCKLKLVDLYQNTLSRLPLKKKVDGKCNVLTTFRFIDEQKMDELGLRPLSSILSPVSKKNIIGNTPIRALNRFQHNLIHKKAFNEVLTNDNLSYLEKAMTDIEKIYLHEYDMRALYLQTDQYFINKYHIEIFRKMGRPSFVFSHGLPGIYSKDVDNRSDYLMVWGEQIKQNYIAAGFVPEKIKVIGHVRYANVPDHPVLRNTLDDILVLPSTGVNWHQHTWNSPQLPDRGLVILYLYQVQHVLQSLGVKKARVRPHPSVDKKWLANFLDTSFYEMDYLPLNKSLSQATLAIGATSTTILEATMNGVNYLVYEPMENGIRANGKPPVPPFDGSEPGVAIAKNETELHRMIKENYQNDYSFIKRYIQPLNLDILKELTV